jgi:hypothetical protein
MQHEMTKHRFVLETFLDEYGILRHLADTKKCRFNAQLVVAGGFESMSAVPGKGFFAPAYEQESRPKTWKTWWFQILVYGYLA